MWFTTFIFKNLRRRPLRTILTIFPIGMAIGSVVALVGIANGFEQTFSELYASAKVDMIVLRAGTRQRQNSILDEGLGTQLKQLSGVKDILAGLMDLISFPDADLFSVPVNGWEAETPAFNHLTITQGRSVKKSDKRVALLGTILASNLGKKVGDSVEIIEGRPYEVIGIYESRNVFENGAVVIPLKELQHIMDRAGKVTGFSLVLDNPNNPAAIEDMRRRVEAVDPMLKAFPTADFVKSFTEIRLAKSMAWLTSCIAVMIGFFGITNTMVMSVNERTREIGILRAVGWQVTRIVKMIMLEAVFLGIMGALGGIVGATMIVRTLTRMPAVNGLIDGRIQPMFLLLGFGVAILLGLAGSVIPALRAASMMPTEALRHE